MKTDFVQGSVGAAGTLSVSGNGKEIHSKKKNTLGGMMNPDEARMNRALL